MITVTVTEMRANLRAIIERVKDGQEIKITQNGEVVAALLHPEKLRRRLRTPSTIAAEKLQARLEKLRDDHPPLSRGGLEPTRAEELVRQLREDRDSR